MVIGITLIWMGIGLRLWAVRTLGRFFTYAVMVVAGQRIVSSGPYRVIRHPSYSAVLMTLLGTGLALGNWASVAALVLLPLAAYLWRIQVEEAALMQSLSEDYTAFMHRTPRRLIPGIW